MKTNAVETRRAFVVHSKAAPGEILAGLLERMGMTGANPFGCFLRPGQRVLVKPNLVFHRHYRGGPLEAVITSPELIRAVCDLAFAAVGPEGEVILGDAPLQSCNWEQLIERTGLSRWPEQYARQGFWLTLADFRKLASTEVRGHKQNPTVRLGDPNGYHAVDLGLSSLHAGRDWRRYRVTNFDPLAMASHHNDNRHEYLISGSLLAADALISLPKLKTHRTSGLTCAMKNLIGINGSEDWLPHHMAGGPAEGGDESPRSTHWNKWASWGVARENTTAGFGSQTALALTRKLLYAAGTRITGDVRREDSWRGNDTLWRSIVDLNRIALYANRRGELSSELQRPVLTIADALTAGEGNGPTAPDPVELGCLIGSFSPVAAETAAMHLAGWPAEPLRHLTGAFGLEHFPLASYQMEDVEIDAWPQPISALARFLRPAPGFAAVAPSQAVPA